MDDKATLENAIEKLIEWLESNLHASIHALIEQIEQLENLVMRIMENYDQEGRDYSDLRSSTYLNRTDL